jgi:hypothetical protein
MNEPTVHGEGDDSFWAPGTIRLEDCMAYELSSIDIVLTTRL